MVGGSCVFTVVAAFSVALAPSVARAQAAPASPAARPGNTPADAAETAPASAPGPAPPRPFEEPQVAPTAGPYPPPPGTPADGAPTYRLPRQVSTAAVVTLHADNPRARLQHKALRWEDVCTTPCGHPVESDGLYRVGGGTIKPSPSFQIPRQEGNVLVEARVGSVVKYWIGAGLALGGLGTVALGGILLANDHNNSAQPYGDTMTPNTAHVLGWTYLVSGAIMTLIGLPLCLSNTTSVEVH
jgi:hypothetical protein